MNSPRQEPSDRFLSNLAEISRTPNLTVTERLDLFNLEMLELLEEVGVITLQ